MYWWNEGDYWVGRKHMHMHFLAYFFFVIWFSYFVFLFCCFFFRDLGVFFCVSGFEENSIFLCLPFSSCFFYFREFFSALIAFAAFLFQIHSWILPEFCVNFAFPPLVSPLFEDDKDEQLPQFSERYGTPRFIDKANQRSLKIHFFEFNIKFHFAQSYQNQSSSQISNDVWQWPGLLMLWSCLFISNFFWRWLSVQSWFYQAPWFSKSEKGPYLPVLGLCMKCYSSLCKRTTLGTN